MNREKTRKSDRKESNRNHVLAYTFKLHPHHASQAAMTEVFVHQKHMAFRPKRAKRARKYTAKHVNMFTEAFLVKSLQTVLLMFSTERCPSYAFHGNETDFLE